MALDSSAQQAGSSSGNDGGGAAGGGGEKSGAAGGGDVDLSELYGHIGKQNEHLERQNRDIMSLRGTNEKNEAFLKRMREAVTGEKEKPAGPTRKERYQQQLDQYLQAGLEAERNGRPIPLTANLAAEFYQERIEAEDERTALKAKIAELEALSKRANDPGVHIDNVAFSRIDSLVENAMNTLYGQDDTYGVQKNHQYDAICAQIAEEVKDLKKSEPALWNSIRRNPEDQRKLVNHYVKQNLPPKARQIMEEQRLRDEKMTMPEYLSAFRQAKEQDQNHLADEIRQQMLAESFMARRGNGIMSRMYRGE